MALLPIGCVVNLASLIPGCAALNSVGGVRTYHYAVRKPDLASITQNVDGSVSAITLTAAGKFIKLQGRKFQNSGAYEVSRSPTGKVRYKHTFNDRIFHDSQAERNAIENLALSEDLVIFSPNNANHIEIYGLSVGLVASSGKGQTGLKLEDDNSFLFVFEGEEPHLPAYFTSVTPPAPTTGTSAATATTASATLALTVAGGTNGAVIAGAGIPAGTTILSGGGTPTLTLSQPASVPASTPLTFTLTQTPDAILVADTAYLDALVNA
jgi:hypothetical protein